MVVLLLKHLNINVIIRTLLELIYSYKMHAFSVHTWENGFNPDCIYICIHKSVLIYILFCVPPDHSLLDDSSITTESCFSDSYLFYGHYFYVLVLYRKINILHWKKNVCVYQFICDIRECIILQEMLLAKWAVKFVWILTPSLPTWRTFTS